MGCVDVCRYAWAQKKKKNKLTSAEDGGDGRSNKYQKWKTMHNHQKFTMHTSRFWVGQLHNERGKLTWTWRGRVACSWSGSKQSQHLRNTDKVELDSLHCKVHCMWCLLREEKSRVTCFYFLFYWVKNNNFQVDIHVALRGLIRTFMHFLSALLKVSW